MSIDLEKMPKLGFGLMRLPENEDAIDLDQVSKMVDRYLETGFNYFDTAYVYHGGRSETAARMTGDPKTSIRDLSRETARPPTASPAASVRAYVPSIFRSSSL